MGRFVKTLLTHGPTGTGPHVQRAAVSGVLAKPECDLGADLNPSSDPSFVGPFSGPQPLLIDVAAYTGDVYVNPQGGSINIAMAIPWAPAP